VDLAKFHTKMHEDIILNNNRTSKQSGKSIEIGWQLKKPPKLNN